MTSKKHRYASRKQIGMLNYIAGENASSGYQSKDMTSWMASNLINTLKPEELAPRATIETLQCPECEVWFNAEDSYEKGWTCPLCGADVFDVKAYLGSLPSETQSNLLADTLDKPFKDRKGVGTVIVSRTMQELRAIAGMDQEEEQESLIEELRRLADVKKV